MQAYSSIWERNGGGRADPAFTGGIGIYVDLNQNIPPTYVLQQPYARMAVQNMSYQNALRYINWLHNGKPTQNITEDAFEQGAYDLRGWTPYVSPVPTRQAGARYFLPSIHEWVKAAYFDPNRYGPGQEGYWMYSGKSMTQLVGGPPGVGQTSDGLGGFYYLPNGALGYPDVGAYADVQSAWGLFDTSGGVAEWTDWLLDPLRPRAIGTARNFGSLSSDLDGLGTLVGDGSRGFRIASVVPSPAASLVLVLCGSALAVKRRRA